MQWLDEEHAYLICFFDWLFVFLNYQVAVAITNDRTANLDLCLVLLLAIPAAVYIISSGGTSQIHRGVQKYQHFPLK
jgi:hypothetical protein